MFDIQNIRRKEVDTSLGDLINQGLDEDPPSLPDLLLWDEEGLKQFEAITYTPEYYLTQCEIHLLRAHAEVIASKLVSDTALVELGSGCLRKTGILLQALEDCGKSIDYYALDLDRSELERSLTTIQPEKFQHVRFHGLLGTYEDGFHWLTSEEVRSRPRTVLSLGSTLGGLSRPEAIKFLGHIASILDEDVPDYIVLGLDGCTDGERVWKAYNDAHLKNETFILNALEHAKRVTGDAAFDKVNWIRQGEWNEQMNRHEQYLVPKKDLRIGDRVVNAGRRLTIARSHKFDNEQRAELWAEAGVTVVEGWKTEGYGLYVLSPEPSSSSSSPG